MEFRYRAKTAEGTTLEGAIDADSLDAATRVLVARGLFPVDVSAPESSSKRGGFFGARDGRLGRSEQALFVRQLSDLLAAGVSLVEALTMLGQQAESPNAARRSRRLADAVREGASIATALEEQPGTLPDSLVAVVRAGEASGSLEQVVARIADQLESEADLRAKVRQALIYPSIVTGASALTLAVLFGYLIPRLSVLYVDMGQTLPAPTRLLLATADAVRDGGAFALLGIGVVGLFVSMRRRRSSTFAARLGAIVLAIPRLGDVIRSREIVQFSGTLATLVDGGVPVLDALRLVERASDNPAIARQLRDVRDRVEHGDSLSRALAAQTHFSGPLITMIEVGERGGSLGASLERASSYYGRSLQTRLQNFVRVLEPTLIFVLTLVVGFIVVAMMLPILELNLGAG